MPAAPVRAQPITALASLATPLKALPFHYCLAGQAAPSYQKEARMSFAVYYKGAWAAHTRYQSGWMVKDSGVMYICILTHLGVTTHPASDSTHWLRLASDGATGPTGAAGPAMGYGIASARPTAGTAGRTYFSSDTLTLSRDNGATWDDLGTFS